MVETERLRLRPATIDDLDAWLAISRDAEEAWFGAPSSDREQARANLQKHMAHQATHGFGLWVVELRKTGDVIGAAGLTHLKDGAEIEVGYRFLKEHWGQGYATEAVRALIDVAFGTHGMRRVIAQLDSRNTASAKLCERLGMTREAYLRQDCWAKGEWTDTIIYGLLATEWQRPR